MISEKAFSTGRSAGESNRKMTFSLQMEYNKYDLAVMRVKGDWTYYIRYVMSTLIKENLNKTDSS